MKKAEMIEALANETGLSKADVERVFNGTFNLFKMEHLTYLKMNLLKETM